MMSDYKNQVEFFEKCGDDYLQPKSFGECIYPVTVEEMYQHFKSRLIDELKVRDGSCSGVVYGSLENKR